jgi:hypothetical protein
MDTIQIRFAADEYQGNAVANITIDGTAQKPVTVTAIHSQGQSQIASFSVPPLAMHVVVIGFANDAHQVGGGPTQDRNLYVLGAPDDAAFGDGVLLATTGQTVTFALAGTTP